MEQCWQAGKWLLRRPAHPFWVSEKLQANDLVAADQLNAFASTPAACRVTVGKGQPRSLNGQGQAYANGASYWIFCAHKAVKAGQQSLSRSTEYPPSSGISFISGTLP